MFRMIAPKTRNFPSILLRISPAVGILCNHIEQGSNIMPLPPYGLER